MKSFSSYLIFEGKCRQAMEFYQKCLGGKLLLMPYSQMPQPKEGGCAEFPEKCKDWIMHARLSNAAGVLMASDTRPDLPVQQGNNFFISIHCEDIAETERLFKALSENGSVEMPLQETFFATRFAMLKDQFGVKWMLNVEKAQ